MRSLKTILATDWKRTKIRFANLKKIVRNFQYLRSRRVKIIAAWRSARYVL